MEVKRVLKGKSLSSTTYKITHGNESIERLGVENNLLKLEKLLEDKRIELGALKSNYDQEKQTLMDDLSKDRSEFIKKKEDEALSLIKQARSLYDKILTEANEQKMKATEIVKREYDEMIKLAEGDRDKIYTEAKNEGHQEGIKKAMEMSEKEITLMIERLDRVILEVLNKRDVLLDELKGDVGSIMLTLVRKVFQTLTNENKDMVLKVVNGHIDKLKGQGRIVIRVNMRDHALLKENRDILMKKIGEIDTVDVIEDPMVDPGGCIIDTSYTQIDARIGKQILRIEQAISDMNMV